MAKNEQERKRIGARIAEIRREKGLTQRGLGALCGLEGSHIARIEMGRYSVGFDTLQAIASAMGCTIDFAESCGGH
jgi:transcriptional regulator with XRE-family HTH domain